MSKRDTPPAPASEETQAAAASHETRIVRDQEKTGPARSARPAPVVAWVCLLIVWVVWGSTYLAIRVGVQTMPPLLMAAVRNLVAGLIMFPLAVSPARLRDAFRRRLPSSLVPRSSVQAAPRPFGSLSGG